MEKKIFSIPNNRFSELLNPMSITERANLYRSLIIEFFGVIPTPPISPPTRPSKPQWPTTGLSDLEAVQQYYEALDYYDTLMEQYQLDYESWEDEVAVYVEEANTLASQATNWIENLASFKGWPFDFVLIQG